MECIEEGIVARVEGDLAIVVATRAEACHKCSAKGTCTALGGTAKRTEVQATNPIGARPGDRVAVSLPGSSIVGAAGLLYFLPAVALIAGAMAGHFGGGGAGLDPDLAAAIGAVAALLVSLGVVALVGRRLGRRSAFTPRISQITARGSLLSLEREEPGRAGPAAS